MTPILNDLVTVSSLPPKAVETEFAVDSSGFGTRRTVPWFSKKHGRPMTAREWSSCRALIQSFYELGVDPTFPTEAALRSA